MSLIFNALRELDRRYGSIASAATPAVAIRPVRAESPWHMGRRTRCLAVAAALALASAAWWFQGRHGDDVDGEVSSMTTAQLPAEPSGQVAQALHDSAQLQLKMDPGRAGANGTQALALGSMSDRSPRSSAR